MSRRRVIPFAEGRQLGTLYRRPPSDLWGGSSEWWPLDSIQEVHGPVEVPTGMQVRLWASQKAKNRWEGIPASLEELRDLSPDDLDSLAVLRAAPGWATHISHLAGLSDLLVSGWKAPTEAEFLTLDLRDSLVSLDVGNHAIGADEPQETSRPRRPRSAVRRDDADSSGDPIRGRRARSKDHTNNDRHRAAHEAPSDRRDAQYL